MQGLHTDYLVWRAGGGFAQRCDLKAEDLGHALWNAALAEHRIVRPTLVRSRGVSGKGG
jgi:hypothetical protein